MKFTKEEISLCKQVAEKHRKDIKYGDWYWYEKVEKVYLCTVRKIPDRHKDRIPLWTISDCLEFLIEKGWDDINIDIAPKWEIQCLAEKGLVAKGYECGVEGWGKTPLEACLKAVLAVLEERG
jgi:hypothetical protein